MTSTPQRPSFSMQHDVEYEIARLMRRSRLRGLGSIAHIHPELDFASYLLLIAIVDARAEPGAGVRGSDLAETVGVHKSTVSRGVATLEDLGLVERVPDPSDGRARLISLTDTASERLGAVQATRRVRLAAALEDWTEDDVDTLAGLLERLNTALEQPLPDEVAGSPAGPDRGPSPDLRG